MKMLINVAELGEIIQRSPATIKKALRTNPTAIPPRVIISGGRALRWRVSDVEQWVASLPTTRGQDSEVVGVE